MNSRTRKSLLQSYYRQRNIAVGQRNDYEDYEINRYSIKNDFINRKKLSTDEIFTILKKYPEFINLFDDRLNELEARELNIITLLQPDLLLNSDYVDFLRKKTTHINNPDNIEDILIKQPKLINYFKDSLHILNKFHISGILEKQPKLINYFKDRLDEIEYNYDIINIITSQPQLINYFKNRLDGFNHEQIMHVLMEQPKLVKYFTDDDLDKLDGENTYEILQKQPQLIEYFKKNIEKMSDSNIVILVGKNPKLIDHLIDDIVKMDEDKTSYIIGQIPTILKHPKYGDFFRKKLMTLSEPINAAQVLYGEPKFVNNPKFMGLYGDDLKSVSKVMADLVIQKHPQLKPYFENEQ